MSNYTVHAMEEIQGGKFFENRNNVKAVCNFLLDAERFVSPLNGVLLEQEEKLASFIDSSIMHLPFPITVFEFPVGSNAGQVTEQHIVLCIDYASNTNNMYAKLAEKAYPQIIKDGGIIVIPIVNLMGKNSYLGWSPSCAMFVISKKYIYSGHNVKIAKQSGIMSNLPINIYPYPTEITHEILYECDKSEWCSSAVSIFQRDIYALFHLLVHLSCRNVETVYNPAPAKLNKKRLLKGKLPLTGFRTVVISPFNNKKYLNGGNSSGGDKRPLREHLRRGHIRKYESGIKIWINNAIICAGRGRDGVKKIYKMVAGLNHLPA